MSNYYYPEKYTDNIFKVATQNSIVIGDWDPYTFPFFYYQFVENKRKDIISLDVILLKRSWYIEMLKHNHPDFIKRSQTEVDDFLKAVEPFENGTTYDGNLIQSCYVKMIYSFIDKNLASNRDVYITFIQNQEIQQILGKYMREPIFAAYKIPRENAITQIDYKDLDLKIFMDQNSVDDRMVTRIKDYYGDIFAARGTMYENLKNNEEAIKYYNLAVLFHKNNKAIQNAIYERIEKLKTK